ncbi:MAG: UvrD-helicase domain-containing protein [Victivallaceae bacterium]|nr:UvrD-helicase domain-containing protein [Victivallaceae bacterium]
MTREEILAQLNPEQGEAASTVNGPVLVLAGAGTGKTRVITFRIAYMLASGIMPEAILGMTFTNKAAREMKDRLGALVSPALAEKVTLGTFHSFCIRLLRRECGKLGYLPGFTIADDSDQQGILKQAAGDLGCNYDGFPLAEVQSMIGRWKNKLLDPDDARRAAGNDFESTAAGVYARYQSLLEMQNSVDFDDMLLLVHRLLTGFPEVLTACRERYRYLLIDEYQDTNAAQFTIVKLLAGDEANLCVVGDDDQSIYSWRGADVGNILDFPEMFPGAKVVKLEQNYRSTNAILNTANAAIGGNARRHDKSLWSKLGSGEPPKTVRLDNAEGEANFICGMIKQIMTEQGSLSYNDFAILYRSNHLSRQLELGLRQSGIPFKLVGGQEFFKRREIKDAVAYLKLAINPRDDQSLLRILGTPPRGLAEKAVTQLKRGRASRRIPMLEQLAASEFQQAVSAKGATAARELADIYRRYQPTFAQPGGLAGKINGFLRDVGYLDGLQRVYKDLDDAMKRRENVDEFINDVAQYESSHPDCTLEAYLENYALKEENDKVDDNSENGEAVTLSTVHAAKGLEFPVVFLVAVEKGLFPHERAVEEGSLDEELRLFYVAVTRAKQQLYLLRTRERMVRGMTKPSIPSPFLALVRDTTEETPPGELLKTLSKDAMRQAFANIFDILDGKK